MSAKTPPKSDSDQSAPSKIKLATNRLVRYVFFVLGGFFVLLALIGVVLPGLPTTPFFIVGDRLFCQKLAQISSLAYHPQNFW